ncbi:holliday junction resolvase [Vibrio phage BONAISHI]|nr:holliday junction resolvase [Vibrio phage BONAISHI]
MGIDPGSNACGFSLVSIDLETFKETVVDSYTVHSKDLLRSRRTLAIMRGEKEARLSGYRDAMNDVLQRWDPDAIVMEHPFMGKFAATFGVLKEQLMIYRVCIWDHNPRLMVKMMSPSEIKKHVGVKGRSSDKNDMLKALIARKDVSYSDSIEVKSLDEHSVDSACAALAEADYLKGLFYEAMATRR